jgi:predicted MPP superfamily phosphohydrolase
MLNVIHLKLLQWGVFVFLTLAVFLRLVMFYKQGMLAPNFGHIHSAYNLLLGIYPASLYAIGLLFGGIAWIVRKNGVVRPGFALFCITIGSFFWCLRYYVTHVEPELLRIHRIEFISDKLTELLRILHLSDTHFPKWGRYEHKVIQTLADLDADLIIHSGDFVQAVAPAEFSQIWQALTRELNAIQPPKYGIYGVFGDTDWDLHRLAVEERKPFILLSSKNKIILTSGGMLDLKGLNLSQSRYPEWGFRAIERWLEESPKEAFRIAIGHAPDFAMGLQDAAIDLILAGHTHGGQVRLPWLGALVIDSAIPKDWAMGFRRIGIPFLNVSAGAGSNRYEGLPPIRFRCPTELTVLDIIPSGNL